jgi:hypothetical protein
MVSPLERFAHILSDRTCNHEHIGMSWRSDEAQTEAFKVIKGIVECVNLQFTAIARTGIHFANRKAPPKRTFAASSRRAVSSARSASVGFGRVSVRGGSQFPETEACAMWGL